jgi:hypothetical protein
MEKPFDTNMQQVPAERHLISLCCIFAASGDVKNKKQTKHENI